MKLKACPFCGSDRVFPAGVVAACPHCHAEAPFDVWNNRMLGAEPARPIIVVEEGECAPRAYQTCIHGIPSGQACPACRQAIKGGPYD